MYSGGPRSRFVQFDPEISGRSCIWSSASQRILGDGRKVQFGSRVFDVHARDQIRSSASVDEMSSQQLEKTIYEPAGLHSILFCCRHRMHERIQLMRAVFTGQ
jgi:hypothetical protein